MDHDALHAFVGRMLGDLAAAASVPLVRIGARLGLYEALFLAGPMTAAELASTTDCAERYLAEWLAQQAASGYVQYDGDGRFSMTPEQAAVFAMPGSPVSLIGAFDLVAATAADTDLVAQAFRTGEGVPYGKRDGCLSCSIARFFRTGYKAHLLGEWLPSLDGMLERLARGARVADVGCGHGHATVMMADAFRSSRFVGFDAHAPSVEAATRHAAEHALSERVRFEVAQADGYADAGFDLICLFDTLHDLGDPVAAARHARAALNDDGVLMVVEPMAGDRLEDNMNVVGRMYYAGSTMVCVPASLAQETGAALGAQAGEARLAAVLREAGFTDVRRVAETPFNMVLQARG